MTLKKSLTYSFFLSLIVFVAPALAFGHSIFVIIPGFVAIIDIFTQSLVKTYQYVVAATFLTSFFLQFVAFKFYSYEKVGLVLQIILVALFGSCASTVLPFIVPTY